ncbi:MAG: transglutaminase-like domain-containing protein [Ferruginibacter sp.]
MALKFLISCSLIFAFTFSATSQIKDNNINFQQVDDFARTVKYNGDLQELTSTLTAPYSDSLYKVRAIFIWIADNIEYDYKMFNSGSTEWNHFECSGSKQSCAQALIDFENKLLEHVLDKKKAVCNGYAKLFKKMCGMVGIQNEMIDGYVKRNQFQIGLILSVTHSWNVVRLGGINYYFDVTWAAGGGKTDEESGKLLNFVKHYQDFYWQTPKYKFMRNHFPKDEKWIAETGYTKDQFFNAPFFYPNDLTKNIESNTPDSGVLKTRVGDTLHFRFAFKSPVKNIQVNTNNYKNVEILLINKSAWDNNIYQFDYVVKENSLYYIEILFDSKESIRYKVKI